MDQLHEVTNINNESTDSTFNDRMEITTEMQGESIKQESDCLAQSQIYIKTEPQLDEIEFPVIAGTSDEKCPNHDINFKMYEPLVKNEYKNLPDEVIQDPLNAASEIKVKEHFLVRVEGEQKNKTEQSKVEKDENRLGAVKDDLYGSGSNQGQNQLLIGNDADYKNKQYVCNVCNKAFGWQSHLDKHFRIHTGEKPYTCNVCERSFNDTGALDRHMRLHSGEKPHCCNVCKKVFTQLSTLNYHLLVHSGVKPYSCNECNKSFTQKSNLVVHKRKHTGERPFACEMCDKAFVTKMDLTIHTRTHTGEKPYSCNICTKLFVSKSSLSKHKKSHI